VADGWDFPLDEFQIQALAALDSGSNVVVAAPTGSGKTVVAEHAVRLALKQGRKVFYTTPLKALSNQKYGDFARAYGSAEVGLLTGDNSINPTAPVVVMTTEVLRNMVYDGAGLLSGLLYVVLDEVHYLQNAYRGPVWEEVIIHAPPRVRLVCLSATVSNAEQLSDWIRTVRGETVAVIEERRPVELHDLYIVGDRTSGEVLLMPTLVDGRPNAEASKLDSKTWRHPGMRGRPAGRLFAPRRVDVVQRLGADAMLPAIYFIFSRNGCDEAVEQCLREASRLTSADERVAIRAVAERHVEALSDEELGVLGYGPWLAGLEAGYAAHHAGMVPPFKEAVEECFLAGLIKVVFATETLSLGINMPARSVVIEKLTKFSGERHEMLSPGDYTQLTGRAGRRGIDDVGYAVVLWSPFVPFDQVASLAGSRAYELRSSFRPTYNMAANLVRRYDPQRAHHLLNLSFAQYQADSDVVRLEARLQRLRSSLEQVSSGIASPTDQRRVERRGRDIERLEARVEGRVGSLARQFDRVLRVLEAWGYLDGWSLTEAGERLARIYHECDLLVAECLGRGLLDGLDPAELASLVSVFTFEARGEGGGARGDGFRGGSRRGRGGGASRRRGGRGGDPAKGLDGGGQYRLDELPTPRLRRRWAQVVAIASELNQAEDDAGVPLSRQPSAGFSSLAYAWAAGEGLADLLADEEVSGGDFVRNVKQLIDLLRQIGEVASLPSTAIRARQAVEALLRGLVAASSAVEVS
jgi:superfamily II RNA helicase